MMTTATNHKLHFASDTVYGICPAAWEALERANRTECVASYGEDAEFTGKARELISELFGVPCQVFFASSGTVANCLALAALCRSYHGIICHPLAHLETDEANGPEFFTGGGKLLHAGGANGRIDPNRVAEVFRRGHGYHSAEPCVLSLTQATEVGTVYTPAEIADLARIKQQHPGMFLHIDGARFANAVAHLGVSPRELVSAVDVLTLGGSKNGLPPTEAIVFFNEALVQDKTFPDAFRRRMKQSGQLTSKMRYLSAPWVGVLENGIWLANAKTANQRASRLASEFRKVGVQLVQDVDANLVFADISAEVAGRLQERGWAFYEFPGVGAYRFACSWNTPEQAIDDLVKDLRAIW